MTDLLTRLLALAELAVDEALQFEYDDPDDRHIWRELQELKLLVAAALAQLDAEGPTDEEIDAMLPLGMAPYTTICGPREIRAFARAVLARWGRSAIRPVPQSQA